MNDRARIGLIIGTVAALSIGGGVWFFAIHQPALRRADAQAEIGRWEARWADARTCLLGTAPRSVKTGEALAIRELEPDPWDRKACTTYVGALNRGSAPNTGIAEVEEAWEQLDGAAQRVAAAFGQHVDPYASGKADPLPDALDGLDAAHERLRVAAGLAASAGGPAVQPLPAATLIPVRDGQSAVTWIDTDQYTPSAHGVALEGRSGSIQVQVTLLAGKAPIVARGPANLLRGVPDATWGALVADTAVQAGPADADGQLQNPGSAKLDAAAVLAAAVGRGDSGAIVAGTLDQLSVIRVAGTTLTPEPPIAIDRAAGGEDVDGRAFAVWQRAKEVHGAWIVPGEPTGAPIALPADVVMAVSCFTNDAVWVRAGGDHVVSITKTGEVHTAILQDALTACGPSGVLVTDPLRDRMYTTCAPPKPCLETTVPATFQRASVAVYKGKLAAVAIHGTVAAVWREGVPLVYFSLPEPVSIVTTREGLAAMTDDKVIDVVVTQKDGGFAILRLPLQ